MSDISENHRFRKGDGTTESWVLRSTDGVNGEMGFVGRWRQNEQEVPPDSSSEDCMQTNAQEPGIDISTKVLKSQIPRGPCF